MLTFSLLTYICNSIDEEKIYVIGGAETYNIAIKHKSLDKIYMTHIHTTYPNLVEQYIYFPKL